MLPLFVLASLRQHFDVLNHESDNILEAPGAPVVQCNITIAVGLAEDRNAEMPSRHPAHAAGRTGVLWDTMQLICIPECGDEWPLP